jgi:hypothetical protein
MKPSILVLFAVAALQWSVFAQGSDSLFYGDSKTILTNPYGWGYISGTNAYGDRGKYQRFELYEKPYLVAARVYFAVKSIVNTPDTVTVVVRDADTSGPTAILASVKITTDMLDTSGVGNLVVFPNSPQFQGEGFTPDSLFVGIEWSESVDDTFAVYADPNGYGDQMQRVWEMIYYNNQWTMWPWIHSPDANFEWNLDSDLWIKIYFSSTPNEISSPKTDVPAKFVLEQNYPNPFNPTTLIRYAIAEGREYWGGSKGVRLVVYDFLGREVAVLVNDRKAPGRYEVEFDGAGLSTGTYFYV